MPDPDTGDEIIADPDTGDQIIADPDRKHRSVPYRYMIFTAKSNPTAAVQCQTTIRIEREREK